MSAWRRALWEASGFESTGGGGATTSQSFVPGTYGAAKQQAQRDTFFDAYGWIDSAARVQAHDPNVVRFDRFGDRMSTHLLTDTSGPNQDYWMWDSAVRRSDKPRRTLPFRSLPRPADVVVMWVADPIPGVAAYGLTRDHYHVRYGEDGAIEIRLWERLGTVAPLMPLIGMAGEVRYYMEVCVKALCEAFVLIAEENWPGTIAELMSSFGLNASWDSGQLEAQVKFTVVEHLKDMLFSGRVTNGRPIRKLTRKRYETLCNKVISRARYPQGPADIDRVGGFPLEKVGGYSMPVAGLPFPPRPVWSPLGRGEGFQGPEDYDYPLFGSVPDPGSLAWAGAGWYWGGNAGAVGGGIVLKPQNLFTVGRTTPIRPPEPGSQVHLRVEWTDPLGVIPNSPQHLASDPQNGDVLDPGMFVFALGAPEGEPGGSGPEFVADERGYGIVWAMGDDPSVPYTDFVFPDAIYTGRGRYRAPVTDKLNYVPIYFNFAKAGVWDLWLTVPDHGGELCLKLAWAPPWFDANASISGLYPIQTVPEMLDLDAGSHRFNQFPRAKLQPPPVLREGLVQLQAVPPGQMQIDDRIHGDTGEPVVMFDPVANGVSTIRHG